MLCVHGFSGDCGECEIAELREALEACARYFDAMAEWSNQYQTDGDTHCIPEGSQPNLDAALEEAMEKTSAALAVSRVGDGEAK